MVDPNRVVRPAPGLEPDLGAALWMLDDTPRPDPARDRRSAARGRGRDPDRRWEHDRCAALSHRRRGRGVALSGHPRDAVPRLVPWPLPVRRSRGERAAHLGTGDRPRTAPGAPRDRAAACPRGSRRADTRRVPPRSRGQPERRDAGMGAPSSPRATRRSTAARCRRSGRCSRRGGSDARSRRGPEQPAAPSVLDAIGPMWPMLECSPRE